MSDEIFDFNNCFPHLIRAPSDFYSRAFKFSCDGQELNIFKVLNSVLNPSDLGFTCFFASIASEIHCVRKLSKMKVNYEMLLIAHARGHFYIVQSLSLNEFKIVDLLACLVVIFFTGCRQIGPPSNNPVTGSNNNFGIGFRTTKTTSEQGTVTSNLYKVLNYTIKTRLNYTCRTKHNDNINKWKKNVHNNTNLEKLEREMSFFNSKTCNESQFLNYSKLKCVHYDYLTRLCGSTFLQKYNWYTYINKRRH